MLGEKQGLRHGRPVKGLESQFTARIVAGNTAKLLDVYPPNEDYLGGYHLNLSDSIIRCFVAFG